MGTEVAHITHDSDTTFKIKRSKVNLHGVGAYCGGLPHSLLYRRVAHDNNSQLQSVRYSGTPTQNDSHGISSRH